MKSSARTRIALYLNSPAAKFSRAAIRRLGKPPAPPPNPDWSCDEPFGWGTCWSDAYVTLEPKILRFESEDVLVVSYGKDTGHHRAKQRTVRRFRL